MKERKKSALQRVAHWDIIETKRPLLMDEMEEKVKALEDFKRWAFLEEVPWRQKSKEIWLKEGDKNTWYFHRMMANAHKRQNLIRKMKINGV